MSEVRVITGQSGPYKPENFTGSKRDPSYPWGANACYNFKQFNKRILFGDYNLNYKILYSKPQQSLEKFINNITTSVKKGLRSVKLYPQLAVNPKINIKSLFGYADEDLKVQNVNFNNIVLAPADTDNDGKINRVESAAFTIMQDILDEFPNLSDKSSIKLKTSQADGKITNVGFINSMGLILGVNKGNTKEILIQIRKGFELDKRSEEV